LHLVFPDAPYLISYRCSSWCFMLLLFCHPHTPPKYFFLPMVEARKPGSLPQHGVKGVYYAGNWVPLQSDDIEDFVSTPEPSSERCGGDCDSCPNNQRSRSRNNAAKNDGSYDVVIVGGGELLNNSIMEDIASSPTSADLLTPRPRAQAASVMRSRGSCPGTSFPSSSLNLPTMFPLVRRKEIRGLSMLVMTTSRVPFTRNTAGRGTKCLRSSTRS
jgi:hypothetical protein